MNAVQRLGGAAALAVAAALVMSGLALASDVNVAVVDVTTPTNAVTLAPGDTASITINMSVTGQQSGTATFEVYRDWTLRTDGTWQGSNPEEFTVPPRSANASATTFSTSGTVSIAAGRAAGGPFTLAIGAFGITNSNTSGAKLNDGSDSNYAVTVSAPPPPANTPPVVSVLNIGSDVVVEKGSPEPTPSCAVVDAQQPTASAVPDISRSGLNEFGLGVVTVTCSFTDNGGLGDSDEASYTIVDTTEPVITFQSRTAANAHGWNSGAVTVTWSCDDGDGSGVVSRSVEQVVSTSGANQSSTGTCTDNADNESTNTVQGINIDTTAPTIQVEQRSGDRDVVLQRCPLRADLADGQQDRGVRGFRPDRHRHLFGQGR
jgi:hypothetical protein